MITQAIRELRERGYDVNTPSVNMSKESITIGTDGQIYMGLSDIAGVGKVAVEEIISHQPYESFDDFIGKIQKRKVKQKSIN